MKYYVENKALFNIVISIVAWTVATDFHRNPNSMEVSFFSFLHSHDTIVTEWDLKNVAIL